MEENSKGEVRKNYKFGNAERLDKKTSFRLNDTY